MIVRNSSSKLKKKVLVLHYKVDDWIYICMFLITMKYFRGIDIMLWFIMIIVMIWIWSVPSKTHTEIWLPLWQCWEVRRWWGHLESEFSFSWEWISTMSVGYYKVILHLEFRDIYTHLLCSQLLWYETRGGPVATCSCPSQFPEPWAMVSFINDSVSSTLL